MRSLNEDNFLLNNTNEKYTVLAVADGMGGHNAGDFASKYTVEIIVEEIGFSKETSPVAVLEKALAMFE